MKAIWSLLINIVVGNHRDCPSALAYADSEIKYLIEIYIRDFY